MEYCVGQSSSAPPGLEAMLNWNPVARATG